METAGERPDMEKDMEYLAPPVCRLETRLLLLMSGTSSIIAGGIFLLLH